MLENTALGRDPFSRLHAAKVEGSPGARPAPSPECLRGLPEQPDARRDLRLFDRSVRFGRVVDGRRPGGGASPAGFTDRRCRSVSLSTSLAVIRCTADPAKVDKRTRSKWSRVLRYASNTSWIPSRAVHQAQRHQRVRGAVHPGWTPATVHPPDE
jgi:hypothetical protein